MPPFTLFPAIDLRQGKVVRLAQGDPARQTTYGDDALFWAERWKAEGAEWLHVVNLDGAFGTDATANWQALCQIVAAGLKVAFGGGLRDESSIRRALEIGVCRIFLGTAAVQNPALVDWALLTFGAHHIAADIGARNGQVTIKGWQQDTALSVLEAGQRLRRQGLEWCVLTDVTRDGVGAGVNVASAAALQTAAGLKVVASGGVASLADVHHACQAGLAGVIIGRALYENRFSIADCRSLIVD